MLGINTNVDILDPYYAIIFDRKNVCCHCGKEGTLKVIDKYDKIVNQEVYSFDHIECENCKAKYGIEWRNKNNKYYPVAVDYSIKNRFAEFMEDKEI